MRFTFSNLPAIGWKLGARPIADLARLCEEVGFDRFAVADLPYHYDCVSVMTACLEATRRLEVESLVINPYTRDPGLVACAWAAMADLSGGRAILGIGGGVESATKVVVAPFGHTRPRPVQAVREAIAVYRGMWRGERVTLQGQVVHVDGAALDCPLPPPIPILVAGRGPLMLRLAGEAADIVHLASLFLNPAHVRESLALVHRGAREAGRDPAALEIDLSVTISVSANREQARHEARRNAAQAILWIAGADEHAKKRTDWKRPAQLAVPESTIRALSERWDVWRQPELPAELEALITDDVLDQFAIAGGPVECAERLKAFAVAVPECTGFRVKMARPVAASTMDDFRRAINGMGQVIAAFR